MNAVLRAALGATMLAAGMAVADDTVRSTGSLRQPPAKSAEAPARLLLPPTAARVAHAIVLPPVTAAELEQLGERSRLAKRLEIGLGRALPAGDTRIALDALVWQPVPGGGRVATVQVQSPGAAALRIAIAAGSLPAGVALRFHAPATPGTVYGPYDAAALRRIAGDADYWSPVVEGDTLAIEAHASGPVAGHLVMPRLSHLVTSARAEPTAKSLGDVGKAGACHVDIACEPASVELGDSVAKYVVTVDGGSSALCTGTLLNDAGSTGTPLLLTANHCVSTQASASTLHTYWFFQRAACGGPAPTSVTERVNGAALRATGEVTDYTLLELNDAPPGGALFAGWSTAAVAQGADLTAIHHPRGDLKKISHGTARGMTCLGSDTGSDGTFIRATWNSGVTEGGSSGSALFNGSEQVIGNLFGGGSACSGNAGNGEADWYGRFDLTFNCIASWLGSTPTGACAVDGPVTTLTSGTATSGTLCHAQWAYYTLTTTAASTGIAARLGSLSADGDLYVRRGALPDRDVNDCKSEAAGTNGETCDVAFAGAATWYIGVYGFESTSYSVRATEGGTGGGGGGGGKGGGGSFSLAAVLGLLALRRAPRPRPVRRAA